MRFDAVVLFFKGVSRLSVLVVSWAFEDTDLEGLLVVRRMIVYELLRCRWVFVKKGEGEQGQGSCT